MIKKLIIIVLFVFITCLFLNAQRLNIAVAAFENKSEYPHSIAPIRDMIVNELFKTGKFSIFEREKLGVVMKEKQLAQIGLIEEGYSEKFKGVDAIVYGSVVGFGKKNDTKGGLGGSFAWGLIGGTKKDTVEVRIHLRIIAVNTGEILGSAEAVGSRYLKKGIGLGLFGGIPVLWGSGGFDNTMIGRATKIAVYEAVKIIENTTRRLYGNIRSDGKIHNRFREKYPSIFDEKIPAPKRRTYRIARDKKEMKIFVSVIERNIDQEKFNSVVETRLISALKEAGYPVVANRKSASIVIDGQAEAYYVATVFDRLTDAEDYRSACAKVNLKIINLTNGEMIDTFSYTLPKPRLHLRTELAGEKALQEMSNLVANRVPDIMDRADIRIVRKAPKKVLKKRKPTKRVELTLNDIKDFKTLSELKKWLVKQKFYPTIKQADFNSGVVVVSVKNTSTFELAEVLNGFGYTITTLTDKKLTAKK
ncbi:hypothetical protein KAJ27_10655 [bacterium]|nr:hypothetical protein [bacterium]